MERLTYTPQKTRNKHEKISSYFKTNNRRKGILDRTQLLGNIYKRSLEPIPPLKSNNVIYHLYKEETIKNVS